LIATGEYGLSKITRARSVTASFALCALLPLNFLTAQGHTAPESNNAQDELRQEMGNQHPSVTQPLHAPVDPEEAPVTTGHRALLPSAIVPLGGGFKAAASSQPASAVRVVTNQQTGHAGVLLNNHEVFRYRADAPTAAGQWQTPTQRAEQSAAALTQFLANGGKPAPLQLARQGQNLALQANGQTLALVDQLTARLARHSTHSLALGWSHNLQQALRPLHTSTPLQAYKPVAKSVVALASKPAVVAHAAASPAAVVVPRFKLKGQYAASGQASWYGPGFHGRRAADGSIFNQNALTAAHRSLPFGTMVQVTNRSNGRQCLVRITDRGPFSGGRVIDLSKKAAETIGMLGSGVASVSIQSLGRG
jgi:rare lipoprotein A (peptidoglycan hydrolase)